MKVLIFLKLIQFCFKTNRKFNSFLQQLGRGLRLSEGKDCLTVLDFVGNSRPEYDFESKSIDRERQLHRFKRN
jgi:superfamily II DNA or RNA helicase